MGQRSMLKGAFVAVLAAALLVIGLGIIIYVGIARNRLVPTPTPRPTPPPAPTYTQVPSPVPMPTTTPEPLTGVEGTVREYTPGALIIVLTPLQGNIEQIIVPENTLVTRASGERASLREIVPGARLRAEGSLDDLGRLVAERIELLSGAGPTTPSAAPRSPTAPPSTPIVRRAWRAEYYDNQELRGAPALTREEDAIDYDWGQGAPAGLPSDGFSARWRGRWPFAAGVYRFSAYSDDGVRLWVDDRLVIDRWVNQAATLASAEVSLQAGDHDIRVEYFEAQDLAQVHVWWEAGDRFSGWHGEYFGNRDLAGMPSLERSDQEISFDWGRGSPAADIPVEGFSARWTRTLDLPRGAYRVSAHADDGIRVRVDGRIFIDEWHESSPTTYVAYVWVTGEGQEATVEYYELAGDANVRVWWEPITTFEGWRGEYYANADLAGAPVFVRDDDGIEMFWEHGSPQEGFPADNFSVRWRRTVQADGGFYRFWAAADDGVRYYVDGERLIDQWSDSPAEMLEAARTLSPGVHQLVVEYYERGGEASIRAGWERIEGPALTATPTASPTVTMAPSATPTSAPATATNTAIPPIPSATATTESSTATAEPSATTAPSETPTEAATATETPTLAPAITSGPEPG